MVEETEADPAEALELAAATGAVEASALLTRAFRESGITQKELAARVGVTEGRVSQILGEETNPRVSTVARYLHAMGYRLRLRATGTGRTALEPERGSRTRNRPMEAQPATYAWITPGPAEATDEVYVREDGVGVTPVLHAQFTLNIAQEDPKTIWSRADLKLTDSSTKSVSEVLA